MQFYTTSNIPTDLARRSFAPNLTRIMPNGGAPLLTMSGFAQKKVAKQIVHGYWKKTAVFPQVTINLGAGYGTGDTVFTIDSYEHLVPGMVLRNNAPYAGTAGQHTALAELIYISSVDSATQITVTRGFAGTTAQAIADNHVLPVVSNAHEQGSSAPQTMAVLPVLTNNYTQIFRNAWDITGTLASTQMENDYNVVAENKADCAAFHAQDIEKALFFGVKTQTTKNSRPLTTLDGIEKLISNDAPTNLWEAASTTTYVQLETYLNGVFDYTTDRMNGNVRTIYCGSTAFQVINDIGRLSGVYQLQQGQTEYGLQFSKFKTSRGVFNVIEHPLFNTTPDWKKMAVIAELSSFDICYLEGRETFHQELYTGTGRDATGGVLTTECTIEIPNPFAWAILYNLRAAA